MTYDADDLDVLNVVLAEFPEVRGLVDQLRGVGALGYPIDSLASVREVEIDDPAGRALLLSLRQAPAFYFPIASPADLVAKVVELRRGGGVAGRLPAGVVGPAAEWAGVVAAGPAAAAPGALALPGPATTVFETAAGPVARPRVEYSPPAPVQAAAPAGGPAGG